MKYKTCQEIREAWIKFFTQKCERKHQHLSSSSLVPENPTLLLTSAGMVQFVPIFMGTKPAPNPPRAVTIQKCARVGGKDSDLENIGRTTRHHSFFEMLGNFSFGDYFKSEVIPWAWSFVTEELELDPQRLYVSVFAGDEQNYFDQEAFDIWIQVLSKNFTNPETRIWKLSRKDNFWGPPGKTGPCGPCTEIYYDLGEHIADKDDRYVEIWNLVFMELEKDENSHFSPLAKKNIDTGAGLERIATIVQQVKNSFETNELFAVLQTLAELFSQDLDRKIIYGADANQDLYLKIITDHVRCLAFLIADGIRPSNVGRGYVLRMIIRRAARFAYLLRSKADAFVYQVIPELIKQYASAYPELVQSQNEIINVCKKEEEQFTKTIANGLSVLEKTKSSPEQCLSGEFVFDLYSTYGLPLELTAEIAKEFGKDIDYEGYEIAKAKHSEVSNTGHFDTSVSSNTAIPEILEKHGSTKFIGYDTLSSPCTVIAVFQQGTDKQQIVLDQTPFYAESGGQLADKGSINSHEVEQVKNIEGIFLHTLNSSSTLKPGDQVIASVNPELRRKTRNHHTSCHLLQAALRMALGNQVRQMGSQVGPEYTRFDFNLDRGLTQEELNTIEKQINTWIGESLTVRTECMSLDAATKAGALSFFEEKYSDEVRVLFIGNNNNFASIELCGGTHVSNLNEIEEITIVSESSVASGIRRIKLLAGDVAKSFREEEKTRLEEQARLEALKKEEQEKAKLAKHNLELALLAKSDEFISKAINSDEASILIINFDDYTSDSNFDAELQKTLTDRIFDKLASQSQKPALIFSAKSNEGKVSFMAKVAEPLLTMNKSIYNAANLVKQAAQICGGGGGGKPNWAQAGGKDSSKIKAALESIQESFCCVG